LAAGVTLSAAGFACEGGGASGDRSVLAAFAAATMTLSDLPPCVTAARNRMPHFSINIAASVAIVVGSSLGRSIFRISVPSAAPAAGRAQPG
jgi:hypothetical protein